jgi:hypothetical protein
MKITPVFLAAANSRSKLNANTSNRPGFFTKEELYLFPVLK